LRRWRSVTGELDDGLAALDHLVERALDIGTKLAA
jgi:hypothetical protein